MNLPMNLPIPRRKIYFIAAIIMVIFIALPIWDYFNAQRLRRDGINTMATVTSVESRRLTHVMDTVDSNQPQTRFYITFEYLADDQIITAVRTRESSSTSPRAPFRVGQQVEIYVDRQNPNNFVFASSSPASGLIAMGGFAALVALIVVARRKKEKINGSV